VVPAVGTVARARIRGAFPLRRQEVSRSFGIPQHT
jgi:hypothetical protein